MTSSQFPLFEYSSQRFIQLMTLGCLQGCFFAGISAFLINLFPLIDFLDNSIQIYSTCFYLYCHVEKQSLTQISHRLVFYRLKVQKQHNLLFLVRKRQYYKNCDFLENRVFYGQKQQYIYIYINQNNRFSRFSFMAKKIVRQTKLVKNKSKVKKVVASTQQSFNSVSNQLKNENQFYIPPLEMAKLYREFSRQKSNKYRYQFPRMKQHQNISKVIKQWHALDNSQKKKLYVQYQLQDRLDPQLSSDAQNYINKKKIRFGQQITNINSKACSGQKGSLRVFIHSQSSQKQDSDFERSINQKMIVISDQLQLGSISKRKRDTIVREIYTRQKLKQDRRKQQFSNLIQAKIYYDKGLVKDQTNPNAIIVQQIKLLVQKLGQKPQYLLANLYEADTYNINNKVINGFKCLLCLKNCANDKITTHLKKKHQKIYFDYWKLQNFGKRYYYFVSKDTQQTKAIFVRLEDAKKFIKRIDQSQRKKLIFKIKYASFLQRIRDLNESAQVAQQSNQFLQQEQEQEQEFQIFVKPQLDNLPEIQIVGDQQFRNKKCCCQQIIIMGSDSNKYIVQSYCGQHKPQQQSCFIKYGCIVQKHINWSIEWLPRCYQVLIGLTDQLGQCKPCVQIVYTNLFCVRKIKSCIHVNKTYYLFAPIVQNVYIKQKWIFLGHNKQQHTIGRRLFQIQTSINMISNWQYISIQYDQQYVNEIVTKVWRNQQFDRNYDYDLVKVKPDNKNYTQTVHYDKYCLLIKYAYALASRSKAFKHMSCYSKKCSNNLSQAEYLQMYDFEMNTPSYIMKIYRQIAQFNMSFSELFGKQVLQAKYVKRYKWMLKIEEKLESPYKI